LRLITGSQGRRLAWALACAGLLVVSGLSVVDASARERQPVPPPSNLLSKYPAGEERLRPTATVQEEPKRQTPVRARLPGAPPTSSEAGQFRRSALAVGLGVVTGVLLLVLVPLGLGGRALLRAERRFAVPPVPSLPEPVPAEPVLAEPVLAEPVLAEPVAAERVISRSVNGPTDTIALTHLLLAPTNEGYVLTEREGEAPRSGAPVIGAEMNVEGRFVVSRVGPSPLPLDPRRCAYLERVDA
jgi:hypothetical protein